MEQTRPTEGVTDETSLPDARGHFGIYGGRFVAETLMPPLDELNEAYQKFMKDPDFQAELDSDLAHFVGRPSPLYHARRLTEAVGGAQIWLKRDRGPLGHKEWPRHCYEQVLWFSTTAKPYRDPTASGKFTESLTMNGYAHSRWTNGGKPGQKGVAPGKKGANDAVGHLVFLTLHDLPQSGLNLFFLFRWKASGEVSQPIAA